MHSKRWASPSRPIPERIMAPTPRLFVQNPSRSDKPWLVLIHGLGMSHKSWTDPFSESLLNGGLSFDYVLTDSGRPPRMPQVLRFGLLGYSPPLRFSPDPPSSFWDSFAGDGYGLLTWSQKDLRGGVSQTIDELEKFLGDAPRADKKILIAHSRGGLIARRYLQEHRSGWDRVAGLVLMGVPHRGSQIAKLARLIRAPSFHHRKNFKDEETRRKREGPFRALFRCLVGYSDLPAIGELIPGSSFLQRLDSVGKEERMMKIPYLNLIGTRTDFIRIYHLGSSPKSKARPIFSLLDGLEKILPHSLVLPEIKQGRGDGLVSIESAHLPWAVSNRFLPVNHAQFLVDRKVRDEIRQFISDL